MQSVRQFNVSRDLNFPCNMKTALSVDSIKMHGECCSCAVVSDIKSQILELVKEGLLVVLLINYDIQIPSNT